MSGGYPLPNSTIPAKKFMVIRQPANPGEGESSCIKVLSPTGGFLRLYNASGFLVDSITYGLQAAGKSTGRYPNGYGPFSYMHPTIGAYNALRTTPESGFLLYPDPASDYVSIEMQNDAEPVNLTIFNMKGLPVLQNNDLYQSIAAGPALRQVDVSQLGSGLHLVRVSCHGGSSTRKLIIY
jgi:hypothetical protein